MIPQVRAISEAQKIIWVNYGHLIGLTILFYDYFLTLDAEIDLLWSRRKRSFSAYWFYINRYFGLCSGLAMLGLPFFTLSLETCIRYSIFREVVVIVTQIIIAIIMVIRVYALYNCSRPILGFLLVIGLGVVGVSLYSFSVQHASHATVLGGCHFELMDSTARYFAGSWLGLLAFDTVVFGLTIYNAFITRLRMVPQTPLHILVVHDGAPLSLSFIPQT
ncbi:hypothetical protein B0H13DRAFT_2521194 [Mycena leptocephala]|nr:hypothetical protein B0H13DRAFT_2521194 [Mycena leptocephala]